MPLTDTQIRTFKPTGKIVKLYDGGGLLLRITARGKKCWQFKYTRNGKQNTIGRIGSYPEVSLKEAREKALILRKKLIDGIDPAQENKERRLMAEVAARTFEVVAREWHGKYARTWTESHARDNMNALSVSSSPHLEASLLPRFVLRMSSNHSGDWKRPGYSKRLIVFAGWPLWFFGTPWPLGISSPIRVVTSAVRLRRG